MAIKFSTQASLDLYNVYMSGLENFGLFQADKYYSALHATFDIIDQHPQIGRAFEETKTPTQRFEFKSHIIFYRQVNDNILIERILHKSVDVPNHL